MVDFVEFHKSILFYFYKKKYSPLPCSMEERCIKWCEMIKSRELNIFYCTVYLCKIFNSRMI